MGQMMGGGGTSGGGDPFAADPFATAGGFAGGGGGGGGGGFGDTGATSYADPNSYDYSGGGQGGSPNDYAYPGGEGATGPWGNMGSDQNPSQAQAIQQAAQSGASEPPAQAAQGGQQSSPPSQPSWVQSVSDLLLGKSGDAAGKMQAEATGAAGGPPSTSEAKGPGWFQSAKPSPIQLPATTAAEYGAAQNPAAQNPANAAVSTPAAAAATPGAAAAAPAAAPVPTPRPRPAEAPQAPAAAPGAADAATVSPQSSPDFGKKSANQAAAETAPGADTAGTASTAPDIAGSAREAGMGPPATAGQGMPQGMGGKGNALGDLLTLNFGRFLGDLFGGQGGQGAAGMQPVGQPRTAANTQPYRPADEQPGEWGATSQGYAYYPPGGTPLPGRPGGMPTGPSPVPATPTGVPGQPSINRAYPQVADVGQALKPQAPGSAAAATTPEPVGTPGTMTVTPMGSSTEARGAAGAATGASGNPTNIPQHVLAGAREAAAQGGPAAVQRWMAQHGHPRSGNWCGEFAAAVMQKAGAPIPQAPEVASNWRTWGAATSRPQAGDIAVRKTDLSGRPVRTGNTGSHVTTIERVDPDGTIHTIGGNQGSTRATIPAAQARNWDFRTQAGAQAAGTQGWGPIPRPQFPVGPEGGVGNLPHESYARTTIQIESGGNPRAVTGSNRGLGQFGPAEERRYGITAANRNNPAVQQRALEMEGRENSQHLQRSGVPATPENLYILHQQGRSGGTALLTAASGTPAWQAIRRYYPSDAVAQRAIRGNIPGNHPLRNVPANQITAGQFREMWQQRYAAMSGQPAVPAAAQNPANAAVASRPPPGGATAGTAEQGARVFGLTPGQGVRLEPGDRVHPRPRPWDPNDPMNTPFQHHGGGGRG